MKKSKGDAIKLPLLLEGGGGRLLLHACCAPCSSAIVEWLMANGVRPTIYYYNPNIWPREEYEIRKNESKRHAESLGITWIDGDYEHERWLEFVSRRESVRGLVGTGVRGCEDSSVRGLVGTGARGCEDSSVRGLVGTGARGCEDSLSASTDLVPPYPRTPVPPINPPAPPINTEYDVAAEPERGRRCEECFRLRLTATARKAQELGIGWFATTLASSRWKSLEQIERAGRYAELEAAHWEAEDHPQEVHFWAQNWRKGGLQERRNQLLREYGFYNQQYCGCEFSAHGVPTKTVLRQQMREAKRQHEGLLARMSAEIVERLAARIDESESRGHGGTWARGCEDSSVRGLVGTGARGCEDSSVRGLVGTGARGCEDSLSASTDLVPPYPRTPAPPINDPRTPVPPINTSVPPVIMAYWPLKDEVDIRPLLDRWVAEGRMVVLPKVLDDERMELRRYTGRDDLREGAYGIMEPVGEPFTQFDEIGVALVPGMAFDAAGRRLGRGKGYYDRFLSQLGSGHKGDGSPVSCPRHSENRPREAQENRPREALILGICFPFQRVPVVPAEAHDVVMDEVIS